jgi:hypothetical protein
LVQRFQDQCKEIQRLAQPFFSPLAERLREPFPGGARGGSGLLYIIPGGISPFSFASYKNNSSSLCVYLCVCFLVIE